MAGAKSIDIQINKSLINVIKRLLQIIESYEADIRNSGETIGIDLVSKGFCQGDIYTSYRDDINNKLEEMAQENKYR